MDMYGLMVLVFLLCLLNTDNHYKQRMLCCTFLKSMEGCEFNGNASIHVLHGTSPVVFRVLMVMVLHD